MHNLREAMQGKGFWATLLLPLSADKQRSPYQRGKHVGWDGTCV